MAATSCRTRSRRRLRGVRLAAIAGWSLLLLVGGQRLPCASAFSITPRVLSPVRNAALRARSPNTSPSEGSINETRVVESSSTDDGSCNPNELLSDTGASAPAPASAAGLELTTATEEEESALESFSSFSSRETPMLAKVLRSGYNDDNNNNNDDDDDNTTSTVPIPTPEEPPGSVASSLSLSLSPASLSSFPVRRAEELVVTGLAATALAGILGDALANYEWIQTLRYFWPISLGAYYGLLWNHRLSADTEAFYDEFGTDAAAPVGNDKDDDRNLWLQLGYVFGGFGLLVGGLADALLPVWMTGPNLVTHAGLAPDCAVMLLALSVGENYGGMIGMNNNNNNNNIRSDDNDGSNKDAAAPASLDSGTITSISGGPNSVPLLLQVALWAELWKLGESSVDEVLSVFQTMVSSSV